MKIKSIILSFCCIGILIPAFSQQAQANENEVISMVAQIYKEVSGTSKEAVDWDRVRSNFVDEAVIVLRTSREASTQFTLDEFIQDFHDFYDSPRLGDLGFKEEVLQLETEVFYDMAFVAVVYSSSILDSDRPPQKGIDFWLLTRKPEGWKAVSVCNEIVRPDGKLPAIFDEN
jgi:hypothetical protein